MSDMIRSSGQMPYRPLQEDTAPLVSLGYVNQSHALADLASLGMSHADAKAKGPRPTGPVDQVAWCDTCHALPLADGSWVTAHLPNRAKRAALTCPHNRRGVALPILPPSSSTPDTMARGKWATRSDAKRVHSPKSHGALTVGRLGVFQWHRTYVTGAADRRAAGAMTPENVSRPIVTTRGVTVPTATDAHLAGTGNLAPLPSFPVSRVLLANGKAPKAPKGSDAAKARTAKARATRQANAAAKRANAEGTAAKAKAPTATAAILADLADLASKAHAAK